MHRGGRSRSEGGVVGSIDKNMVSRHQPFQGGAPSAPRAHMAGVIQAAQERPSGAAGRLEVRWRRIEELDERDLQAWAGLESRAAEPNVYLSPNFVLPALRHLDAGLRPVIAWIEAREGSGRELAGVGVFRRSPGSRSFPWPHLSAYLSCHSFLGGLLLDAEMLDAAVAALMRAIGGLSPWQGLVLPKTDCDGVLAQALERQTGARALSMLRLGSQERAMLDMSRCGEDMLRELLGKKLNEVNRCRRRLAEMGELSWHCLGQDGPLPESAVENFLHLEHQGWKGESGTSVRSVPAEEAFFREMVARFDREGRALFTELRIDGRAVASTCNFVSGTMGFAFKVGWDPELRKFGPGMLNEIEFIRQGRERCPNLTMFESGASADSFISKLWPGRRHLGALLVPGNRIASAAMLAAERLRQSRQSRRLAQAEADAPADTPDTPPNQSSAEGVTQVTAART